MKILNLSLMVEHTPNGFQKAMRSVCSGYAELNCGEEGFNEKAVQFAKELRPNIIFVQIQQPGILTIDTAKELSEIGFLINWTGDVRTETPQWMVDLGNIVHLTCFSNMVDVENCRGVDINSAFLEIGFDPERYKKHKVHQPTPEIVAHFNSYGNFPLSNYRNEIVEALKEEFKDNFGLFGNSPGAKADFNHDQVQESINYNNAKIAINCSHFNYNRYSSDRLLRILGSGPLCLSHDFEGIELDYKKRVHLDTFCDIPELIKKCKHYLSNPLERDLIAKKGFDYAHKNYTFKNMALNIIKLYNGRK